jgi:hypothetical protein
MKDEEEMKDWKDWCKDEKWHKHKHWHHGDHGSNALYGLGIFGAAFYFLQGATTFTAVVVGIIKAIFWPAFVVFKVLTFLKI